MSPATLLPLADWPRNQRRALVGLFTDIDDTLTTDGAITPDALEALAALKAAGLHVIAVTGRPVGWSAPFAAAWPVDAIVAENGAAALHISSEKHLKSAPDIDSLLSKLYQPRRAQSSFRRADVAVALPLAHPCLRKSYQQDAATRAANSARMQAVLARIEREVPGARRAADSCGRECDIAIDHSEFTQLPPEDIARVLALMRAEGMNASVSSIHVNGWYGAHDKWAGARWIVRALLGRALDAEIEHWAYVGDSANDQVMFAHVPHSVGVANIARFLPELAHKPRYLTQGARGAGFAEVAQAILAAR